MHRANPSRFSFSYVSGQRGEMDGLDPIYKALASETRRAILLRLALDETTVAALCSSFDISAPAISTHLRVLEKAALITTTRCHGNHRICRLNPESFADAKEWLDSIHMASLAGAMPDQTMRMDDLDPIFRALANQTRRAILHHLTLGETNEGTLRHLFEQSDKGLWRHLQFFKDASFVTRSGRGIQRILRLKPNALANAKMWLDFIRRA
jgi:DNA-binding transcriptional ArsR family regulator